MAAERLIIQGRVQGVGYRAWAVDQARRLGVRGWVRNRTDGTVEMLAAADDEALDRFVAICKEGPPAANVTRIDREASDPPSKDGFVQRPTA